MKQTINAQTFDMNTDYLSNETYEVVIIEAERFPVQTIAQAREILEEKRIFEF